MMKIILTALMTVFSLTGYRVAAALSFVSAAALYFFTLPALFTGGRVGFVSLRFLTPELAVLAVVMAALLALILPLIGYLVRRGRKARTASTAGGVAVGLLAPLLCCSPVLPVVLGFFGGVFPLLGGAGFGLQGFLATHESGFFAAAIVLLVYALYQNARSVCEEGCRLS
ncbi:MAG: hypothetical protein ACYCQK_07315 [Acidiferrobacteraceae bacterium]